MLERIEYYIAQINYSPLPTVTATDNTLQTILSVIFGLAGAVALIFIAIGGFRYIVSKGDPSGTAQAKNTILYAIIGLIVVIVSFSIITFVINRL